MCVTIPDIAMDAVQEIFAMLKTLNRWILIILAGAVVAGCGQKGPLYLPGDPSSIYAAPPQTTDQTAEEADEDDDEDSSGTIQD